MSNREKVLQRLEAAVSGLEAAVEQRIAAGRETAGGDAELQGELNAVLAERDRLTEQVQEQSKHNADLGERLDAAIAKLSKVLETA